MIQQVYRMIWSHWQKPRPPETRRSDYLRHATFWGYAVFRSRLVPWRADELEAWIAAGCPPRNRWTWPPEGA